MKVIFAGRAENNGWCWLYVSCNLGI